MSFESELQESKLQYTSRDQRLAKYWKHFGHLYPKWMQEELKPRLNIQYSPAPSPPLPILLLQLYNKVVNRLNNSTPNVRMKTLSENRFRQGILHFNGNSIKYYQSV